MKPLGSHLTNGNVHSVLGFVRSAYGPHWESSRGTAPFVTISRQTGAGGADLGRVLVERLNERDRRAITADGRPWTVWDHELVDKVAAEHNVPAALVEALEETKPSWLGQFLASLPSAASAEVTPDEFKIYRRVALTIRALTEVGRVVIVGRGGAFITRDMPMGVRIRLIAPLRDRVKATAAEMGLAEDAAAKVVRDKDERRQAFLRRHWPGRVLEAEGFTATINTAAVAPGQLVECVLPMVPAAAIATQRAPAMA